MPAMPHAMQNLSTVGSKANRLLRFALSVAALIVIFVALRNLILHYPWGADLEIPLRAARRWLRRRSSE